MRYSSVSACLIVCNEAHCLARCLDSIANFVDQIIVVDTGSTDNTVSIAESYGAIIRNYSWNNNFADARNYSLSLATGDWILVIDADEELTDGRTMLDTLKSANHAGYYVTISNQTANGHADYEDYVVRLFRNNQGFTFSGAIHEQIAGCIYHRRGQSSIAFSSIVLRHYGYLPAEICRKQKNERNRSIIQNQLAINSNDPFLLYCLGIEMVQAAKLREAGQVLNQALAKFKGNEGYLRDYLLLTLSTNIKLKQHTESEPMFKGALAIFPDDSDILFLDCIRQANLQNYQFAWSRLTAGGINTTIVAKALVNAVAGEILSCQGFFQSAIHYFQQSLREQPTIFAAVSLIEIARNHNIQLVNIFSPIEADYLPLVQDAQSGQDYPLAAILLLIIINSTPQVENSSDLLVCYYNVLNQTRCDDKIKNLLILTARQIEVYGLLATHGLLISPLINNRNIIIMDSLNIWLRLWPKHNFSTKIWECCL